MKLKIKSLIVKHFERDSIFKTLSISLDDREINFR